MRNLGSLALAFAYLGIGVCVGSWVAGLVMIIPTVSPGHLGLVLLRVFIVIATAPIFGLVFGGVPALATGVLASLVRKFRNRRTYIPTMALIGAMTSGLWNWPLRDWWSTANDVQWPAIVLIGGGTAALCAYLTRPLDQMCRTRP